MARSITTTVYTDPAGCRFRLVNFDSRQGVADWDNKENYFREHGTFPVTHYTTRVAQYTAVNGAQSLRSYLIRLAVFKASRRPQCLPNEDPFETHSRFHTYYHRLSPPTPAPTAYCVRTYSLGRFRPHLYSPDDTSAVTSGSET